MNRLYVCGVSVAALILGGCQTTKVGPHALRTFQNAYNQSVAMNESEQLLQNIVRLRYRDNPVFMEVAKIDQKNAVNTSHKLAGSKTVANAKDCYTGALSGDFFGLASNNESNLSFGQLKGKDFIQTLMTPVQLPVILALSQAGWKPERVFNLCVERVNDLYNAPTADGPTPEFAPEYKDFYRWTALFGELQRKHCLDIGDNADVNFSDLHLGIRNLPTEMAKIAEFKKLAGLNASASLFKWKTNFLDMSNSKLVVRGRTLLGILFFLSQGIEVPQKDIDENLVTVTKNFDGSAFDWSQIMSRLMNVHCAESRVRPNDAYVACFYRNKWFYISDNDAESKATFLLLSQIYTLQSSKVKEAQPVLVL